MILGITPARGGSKRVPRKNIRPICGKPLIGWTIEAAQKSKRIDKYIVSTDDGEIADVAESYGADVLMRPSNLSHDDTPTIDVLQHAINRMAYKIDAVVLLQATSPVRDEGMIDDCIDFLLDTGKGCMIYDSLATGYYTNFKICGGKSNRCFLDDGNIYVMRPYIIRDGDRFGEYRLMKELDQEQNIEIDTEFDFWMAEQILQKRMGERND